MKAVLGGTQPCRQEGRKQAVCARGVRPFTRRAMASCWLINTRKQVDVPQNRWLSRAGTASLLLVATGRRPPRRSTRNTFEGQLALNLAVGKILTRLSPHIPNRVISNLQALEHDVEAQRKGTDIGSTRDALKSPWCMSLDLILKPTKPSRLTHLLIHLLTGLVLTRRPWSATSRHSARRPTRRSASRTS